MEKPELKQRALWVAVAVSVLLMALAGRLWQLQIVRGEDYAALADGNRMRRLSITAPRGIIRDRSGRILADNRLAFTVSVVPGGLQQNAADVVAALARILHVDVETIEDAIEGAKREYPYEPIRVLRDVPADVVVAVEENRMDLPGVVLEQEPMRRYPAGPLASHIVGYLLLATPENLRSYEGYRADDLVGHVGIERAYESYLRGEPGFAQVEVNALSRAVREFDPVPPVPGADLVLTLDLELQEKSTAALQRQLDLISDDPERQGPVGGGAVLVLDVNTGAVLAMVSLPTYDAQMLLTERRGEYLSRLNSDPLQPMFHRATQGRYAPGSAFKPVTLLAAVERGVVDPRATFNATGSVTIGGTVFRDWTTVQGLPPAGKITAVQALERSVNDYFFTIGTEAGIQAIADTARRFGLGGATGLDMSPSGSPGRVPDPAWKRAQLGLPWFGGDTANVSIGQGDLLMTPLQMAMLYSGIANRGTVFTPYLVQTVTSPTGEIIQDTQPVVLTRYGANQSDWDVMEEGLREVIVGNRGTARRAFEDFPVAVAGKTGSAETAPNRESHAWFAAYAPMDKPEIAVAVLIEYGGGGGGNAAPVGCRVLAAYFGVNVYGPDPDDPEGPEVPMLCS